MKFTCLVLLLMFISRVALSQDGELDKTESATLANVDAFIEASYTPTFDCPQPALLAKIEEYLSLEGLTKQQRLQLTSMQTHSMICKGQFVEAQSILQSLLAEDEADRSAKYYMSAIFQYGFVYDQQENSERCNYYLLARDSAANKFSDIHLSASLGFITECMKGEFDKQLAGIYETMQIVTRMNEPAAMAHAHNRLALFYSANNQVRLASKQYIKAYEAGKEIYTNGNLLSILGSAITAFTSTHQFDLSTKYLNEYERLNETVGTRRSNFVFYMLKSQLAVQLDDRDMLKTAMAAWNAMGEDRNNYIDFGFHRWYRAELCFMDKDLDCLKDYIETEKSIGSSWKAYTKNSQYYLSLLIRINTLLGNNEVSAALFDEYESTILRRVNSLEKSTESMNISGLHDKIGNLKTELDTQNARKINLLIGAMVLMAIVTVVLLYMLRKRQLERKSIDSVTGLYNNTAVINKLVQLPAPGVKRTNALAIFDIANFTEVNLSVGSDKSDFVLRQIANTFKKITRDSDILGRFGPGQFILCLADIEEDAAQAFFERTKEALGNTFAGINNHRSISVDSSMSIYYSTDAFKDINEILSNMLLSLSMKAKKPS